MMRRRGIFFVDSVVALGLVVAVTGLLVAGKRAAAGAARAGEDRRAAVRLAEAYLNGAPAGGVTVTALPDAAPTGWRWAAVRADVGGQSAELVGLVREGQ